MAAIHDIEVLLARILVSSDHSKQVFLDLSVWNASLKWLCLIPKSGANRLTDGREVNELGVGAVLDNAGDEGFATELLTCDQGVLRLISEMLIEDALIPRSHGLQTVLLLK